MMGLKARARSDRRRHAPKTASTGFAGSLAETAVRALVTTTVTFAAGWALKRLFEKSMADVTKEAVKPSLKLAPSKQAGALARYRAPERRLSQEPAA